VEKPALNDKVKSNCRVSEKKTVHWVLLQMNSLLV